MSMTTDGPLPTSLPADGPQVTDGKATPPAEATPAALPEDWGYDLLLYGQEQILRASDNGVLVAFAAIAFQDIRGDKLPHYNTGFGFLLFSVLMCAVVHFALGSAFVGRARRLIRRQQESRGQFLVHGASLALAWLAGAVQLSCIVVGLILVLSQEPPPLLRDLLSKLFPVPAGG